MPEDNSDQATEQQPAPKPHDPAQGHGDGTDWKAQARRWEDQSRQNHGKLKDLETQLDQIKAAISSTLGITETADPKALAEQLQAAQRDTAQARRESAIIRRAAALNANPDKLTDSASFARAIEQIDPTDTAALDNAIKAAVEANPYMAATVPPAQGAGYTDTHAGQTPAPADADAEALKVLGF